MKSRNAIDLRACFAVASLAAFVALAGCAAGPARAELREEQFDLPVKVVDAYGKPIEQTIKVSVFNDAAIAGPKPVIVINHGRAANPADRASMGRARFPAATRWFAQQGFIVVVPTRIGYGASGGEDVENGGGTCSTRNFMPGFLAAAEESIAALDAARSRPDALKDRSVILGQSYGGATTVAAASLNPRGVAAAINFAGGSGGDPKHRPQNPCSPQVIERTYAKFGETSKIPMLWAYTENDQFWGAAHPREWFDAYRSAGAAGEFVQFTPHGEDGHLLFARFPDVWKPVVADFLRKQGFEMKDLP